MAPTLGETSGSSSASFNPNLISTSSINPLDSTETSPSIHSSSSSVSRPSASASGSIAISTSQRVATSQPLSQPIPTSTTTRAIGLQEEVEVSSTSDSAEATSTSDATQPLASASELQPSDMPTLSTSRDQLIAPSSRFTSSSADDIPSSTISSAQSLSTSISTSSERPRSSALSQKPAESQQSTPSTKAPASENDTIPSSSQPPEIEAEPISPPSSVIPAPERVQSTGQATSRLPPVKVENGKSSSQASSDPLPTTFESEILDPARTETDGATAAPSTLVIASSSGSAPSLATSISLSFAPPSSSSPSGASIVLPTGTGTGRNTNDDQDSGGIDVQLQSDTDRANPPTGAIIGGVVGGIALIALVGLLIWLWKRNKNKKQQGQPLTPLSARPGDARYYAQHANSEKNNSHQPGAGIFSALAPRSRSRSSRFQPIPTSVPRDGKQQTANVAPTNNWWQASEKQPVALHLPPGARGRGIGSDKKRLDPQETGPGDDPKQGPGTNPFSDAHEIQSKAGPQPLRGILKQPPSSVYRASAMSGADLAAAQRSGAHTMSGYRSSKATSAMSRLFPSRRTSSNSDSSEDRRIKFLSDPFDLEFDLVSSTAPTPVMSSEPMPRPLDPRASSIYSSYSQPSSKYASGTTISNWGDVGPTPPVEAGQVPGHDSRDRPTFPQESSSARRASQASSSGVGRAL